MVHPSSLRRAINYLVYFSVALGVLLLVQLYGFLARGAFPPAVFYSILVGWLAYLATATMLARGRDGGTYKIVLVLALLTLVVSVPQPEHYAFFDAAQVLPAATFLAGSISQVAIVVLVAYYLVKSR